MRKLSILIFVGTFLLSACGTAGSLKSKRAIQGAIETHLKNNPDLSLKSFDTRVESVKFKGNTAEAVAKFVAKQPPHNSVEVRYQLKLEGGTWKVVSGQSAGGQGMGMHGGAMSGSGSMGQGAGMSAPAPAHGQSQPAPESSH